MKQSVQVYFDDGTKEIKLGDYIYVQDKNKRQSSGDDMKVTVIGKKYITAVLVDGNHTYGASQFRIINGQRNDGHYMSSSQAYLSKESYEELKIRLAFVNKLCDNIYRMGMKYEQAVEIAKILNFKE